MAKKISTKEKILIAARKLFVEFGFAGTSIGKIAELAQVNHSLIFHHFDNKEGLWIAVKHNIVADQPAKTVPSTTLSFSAFLKKVFSIHMDFYSNNPDIIRMLNWQRLEHAEAYRIGLTHTERMQTWIKAFQHYQQQGDINPKLKPEFIITLIFSIISSAALDPNVFINSKKDKQAYIKFCVEHLLKSLQP